MPTDRKELLERFYKKQMSADLNYWMRRYHTAKGEWNKDFCENRVMTLSHQLRYLPTLIIPDLDECIQIQDEIDEMTS